MLNNLKYTFFFLLGVAIGLVISIMNEYKESEKGTSAQDICEEVSDQEK